MRNLGVSFGLGVSRSRVPILGGGGRGNAIRKPVRLLIITVDFDAALSGRYALVFKPKLPVQVHGQCRVTVEVVACGRRQVLGRTYVYELPDGGVKFAYE